MISRRVASVWQRTFQKALIRHFRYLQRMANGWPFRWNGSILFRRLFSTERQAQWRNHHLGWQRKKLFEVSWRFRSCTWTEGWCIWTCPWSAWTLGRIWWTLGDWTGTNDERATGPTQFTRVTTFALLPFSFLHFSLFRWFGHQELLDPLLAFRQLLLYITELLAFLNQQILGLLSLGQFICQLLLQIQNSSTMFSWWIQTVLALLFFEIVLQQLQATLKTAQQSLHHLQLLVLVGTTLLFTCKCRLQFLDLPSIITLRHRHGKEDKGTRIGGSFWIETWPKTETDSSAIHNHSHALPQLFPLQENEPCWTEKDEVSKYQFAGSEGVNDFGAPQVIHVSDPSIKLQIRLGDIHLHRTMLLGRDQAVCGLRTRMTRTKVSLHKQPKTRGQNFFKLCYGALAGQVEVHLKLRRLNSCHCTLSLETSIKSWSIWKKQWTRLIDSFESVHPSITKTLDYLLNVDSVLALQNQPPSEHSAKTFRSVYTSTNQITQVWRVATKQRFFPRRSACC